MAAHAIASGTISFGLVSVPVRLYSATKSKDISFNLLHAKDKSRLKQQYVCQTCGELVERGAMAKGYEIAKGQYVSFSEDELNAIKGKSEQSIEIAEFVPIAEVDPIYFEKSYLLGPDKGGQKAYRLLCEAMQRAGQGAVAKYSTHGKEQLVLLRQARGGLLMHALFYGDEVRGFEEIEVGSDLALKPVEIDLAVQLIGQLASTTFDPSKYEDEYRKTLLGIIEQKAAGQQIVAEPAQAPRAQIIDLMDALKASIAARHDGATGAGVPTSGNRKPAARAKDATAAPRRMAKAK